MTKDEYNLMLKDGLKKFILDNSKLLNTEEWKRIFEWINANDVDDTAHGISLMIAILRYKYFESFPEFRGMNIDTYTKKMDQLKRNADELVKFSNDAITINFPVHPNTSAASYKLDLDRSRLSKSDKERYWDAYKDFTGISQIRKTKANKHVYEIDTKILNPFDCEQLRAEQQFYSYTAIK